MANQKPFNPNPSQPSVTVRKATSDEIAYRDGYVQGQNSERRLQYSQENERESSGIASGLILGLLFTALLGTGIAIWFYSSGREDSVEPTTASPSPEVTQPQNTETRVIERTVERTEIVPVEVPAVNPPEVNIEVPTLTTSPSSNTNSLSKGYRCYNSFVGFRKHLWQAFTNWTL
jgi:hypothetical protein